MRRKNKFLLLLFSVLVLSNTKSFISHATTTQGTDSGGITSWDGMTTDTEFEGEGTKDNPYLISDSFELAGLRELVNSGNSFENKYLIITNSLDLGNHDWIPIGTKDNPFLGNIKGGPNSSIVNYSISDNFEYNGVFGYVGNDLVGASISNLVFSFGINIYYGNGYDNYYVGGVAGYISSASSLYNIEINDLSIFVQTRCSKNQNYHIGAFVGLNEGNMYNLSLYDIDINGNNYVYDPTVNVEINIGSIVGTNNGRISNCVVQNNFYIIENGNVGTANEIEVNIGGIVGKNTGSIVNSVFSYTGQNYEDYVFYAFDTDSTDYEFIKGTVATNIGAVAGFSSGSIEYSYYYLDEVPNLQEGYYYPNNDNGTYAVGHNEGSLNKVLSFIVDESLGTATLEDYGYSSSSYEVADSLNEWVDANYNVDYFSWETGVNGQIFLILSIECEHNFILSLEGDYLTVFCNYCQSDYKGTIVIDIVQTVYTGYPLKPILVEFNRDIDFEYQITYKNNIEPGEATAIISVGSSSVEYKFIIVRNEDLNPQEAISITETGINNINNYTANNDEDLQNSLDNIDSQVKDQIVNSSQNEIDTIKQQYENGELSDIEIVDHANKVYQVARSAIIVENEKEWRIPRFEELDVEGIIKVADYYSTFINNQFNLLLEYDYDISINNYWQSSRMAKRVGDYMESSSNLVHECDGEENVVYVEQYVSSLSMKMFKDYNEQQANEEFVEMAYEAIFKFVQQESLKALDNIYQDNLESGKYFGSELDKLKKDYESKKLELENDDQFEVIMLNALKEKYITLVNRKHDDGIYSLEEKEALLENVEDLDQFEVIYKDIFRKWALNEESEITLEELTSTVVESFTTIKVNKELTKEEIIIISSIAGLSLLAVLLKFIFSKAGWLNG